VSERGLFFKIFFINIFLFLQIIVKTIRKYIKKLNKKNSNFHEKGNSKQLLKSKIQMVLLLMSYHSTQTYHLLRKKEYSGTMASLNAQQVVFNETIISST
jgi:hypothetical protein